MTSERRDIYKIAVPQEWLEALLEAIRESADIEGLENYDLSELSPEEAPSELQFDPVILWSLAKFVIESAGAYLVGCAIERLLKKVSVRKVDRAKIIVMFPDGEVETLDVSDKEALAEAIQRLKGAST